MSAVRDFLDGVHLGPRQAYKQLTLWPLVGRPRRDSGVRYVPLADALEQGSVCVDEVSQGGSVPHVRVRNQGDAAVLVLFGEELRGAKQNRIANASFLVGDRSDVVIDVSCVEQGRWGGRSSWGAGHARFETSHSLVSSSVRRKMARKVAAARDAGRGFDADQAEVWGEVEQRIQASRAISPTRAYADYLGSRARDMDEVRRAFQPVEGQLGFVAMIGDTVAGIEAIGRPEVFASCFERLVDGYAIDAIDHASMRASLGDAAFATRFGEPEPFLEALRSAPARAAPSLGLGRDLRIDGPEVEGCALEAGELIHLSAYPRLAPDRGRDRDEDSPRSEFDRLLARLRARRRR
jgi:hypothetical protein